MNHSEVPRLQVTALLCLFAVRETSSIEREVLSHEDAAMGSVGAVCCVLHLLEHQLLRLRTASCGMTRCTLRFELNHFEVPRLQIVLLVLVTMSGQEYKDGQEPTIYAITNTWRHHGINQHHHALQLTPGEILADHDCTHNLPTPALYSPTGGPYTPPDVASQKLCCALRRPRQRHGVKIRLLHAQGVEYL